MHNVVDNTRHDWDLCFRFLCFLIDWDVDQERWIAVGGKKLERVLQHALVICTRPVVERQEAGQACERSDPGHRVQIVCWSRAHPGESGAEIDGESDEEDMSE